MDLSHVTTTILWPNAIGVVPLVLAVAAMCRWLPCRGSTRHAMWVAVLLCCLLPPIIPVLRPGPASQPGHVGVAAAASGVMPTRPAPSRPESAGAASERSAGSARPAPPASLEAVASALLPGAPLPTARADAGPASPISGVLSVFGPSLDPDGARLLRPAVGLDVSGLSAEASGLDQSESGARPGAWGSAGMTSPAAASPMAPARAPGAPSSVRLTRPALAPAAERPRASVPAWLTDAWAAGATWLPDAATRRAWLAWTQNLRTTVSTLPPLPAAIWLAGIALLGSVALARIVRFRRLLNSGTPAPGSIQREVDAAAGVLGLRRTPQALLVSARVPPMIWCAGPCRLIIPRALWADLDGPGRSAVILHELAHLRRRDHWVCWAEVLVSLLYWWHPLIWWVRRRIREEADCCCDAWVTALLPRQRRAYAQALLSTRAYLSVSGCMPPAAGLGVTTVAAKRFARRLTMVMKERTKPGVSVWGIALSLSLGAAGALTAPIWACPPDSAQGDSVKARAEKAAQTTPRPARAPRAPRTTATTPALAPMASDDATTFEHFMAGQHAPAAVTAPPGAPFAVTPAPRMDDDRMRRLDEQMRRMDEKLRRLEEMLNRLAPGAGQGQPKFPASGAPARPGASTGKGGATFAYSMPDIAAMPGVVIGVPGRAGQQNQGVVARVYRLPSGKLEALTALMKRQDVPILVGEVDGGLQVQATARQHAVVEAFIRLINPSDGQGASAEPGGPPQAAIAGDKASNARTEVLRGKIRSQVDAATAHAALASALRSLTAQADSTTHRAEDLAKQSSRAGSQAETLEQQVEMLKEHLQSLTGGERQRAEAKASQMAAQSKELSSKAAALERQADRLREEADRMRERAEEMRQKAQEHAGGNDDEQDDELQVIIDENENEGEPGAEIDDMEAVPPVPPAPPAPPLPPLTPVADLPPIPPAPPVPPTPPAPAAPATAPVPPTPPTAPPQGGSATATVAPVTAR